MWSCRSKGRSGELKVGSYHCAACAHLSFPTCPFSPWTTEQTHFIYSLNCSPTEKDNMSPLSRSSSLYYLYSHFNYLIFHRPLRKKLTKNTSKLIVPISLYAHLGGKFSGVYWLRNKNVNATPQNRRACLETIWKVWCYITMMHRPIFNGL